MTQCKIYTRERNLQGGQFPGDTLKDGVHCLYRRVIVQSESGRCSV